MQQLQPNTLLQGGKYKIIKSLGQGGFGITYLAEQTMLDGLVAIKEFFFKQFCDRNDNTSQVTVGTSGNQEIVDKFQQKFIKEARTIFKLNHPNIVRILDIFEENGTAYYVMDYIEGESLGNIVKRCGSLKEYEAINYINKVGRALSYIHSNNINHLDVKPDNIMCRRGDGEIVLIDFGVSKQYDSDTKEGTTTTPVGISHGYSPLEQYKSNGVQEFSPQSDVYALAATLFKLLTGKTPPEAIEVQEEGLPICELERKGVSRTTINAIAAAMKSRKQRTQSIDEFLNALPKISDHNVNIQENVDKDSIIMDKSPFNSDKVESDDEFLAGLNDIQNVCLDSPVEGDEMDESPNVCTNQEIEYQEEEGTVILNVNPVIHEDEDFQDLGLSVRWSKKNSGIGHYYTPDKLDTIDMPNEFSRIPTMEEWNELITKCSFTWVEKPERGYEVKGPYGTTIFLPALGMANNAEQRLYGEQCWYWNAIDSLDRTLSYSILCDKYKITNCKVAKTRNDVSFPIRLVTDK